MTNESEVVAFLHEFKIKMKIWDVLFRSDRDKNAQTMLELEITYRDAKGVLERLIVHDYS